MQLLQSLTLSYTNYSNENSLQKLFSSF
ncbi:hypothetical protein FVR03_19740 [Pontibacter qinzhouensis]|uniref:Uncharacterized protein n=1 Tax=Pontibacter qinzhouensis TaxID=2603253 RepID=A0A5C8J739_9BACT|nr:hypothetical protein FVR03_19740 [Pontibacter qinzhouensis]